MLRPLVILAVLVGCSWSIVSASSIPPTVVIDIPGDSIEPLRGRFPNRDEFHEFGVGPGVQVNLRNGSLDGEGIEVNGLGAELNVGTPRAAAGPNLNSILLRQGTVNFLSGTTGVILAENGLVNMRGGLSPFYFQDGGEMLLEGGVIDDSVFANTDVLIAGGQFRFVTSFEAGTRVRMTSGTLGSSASITFVGTGSTFSLEGGDFEFGGDGGFVDANATFNFRGSSFRIDGEPVPFDARDEVFTLTDRDVRLTGRLADGTPIDVLVGDRTGTGSSRVTFDPSSTITLTNAVPEPSGVVLFVLGLTAVACSGGKRQQPSLQ